MSKTAAEWRKRIFSPARLTEELLLDLEAAEARIAELSEETVWTEHYEGESWECSKCGAEWCFTDSGPVENGMKFCPKCGRKIAEVVRWKY
jgi:hypothetical protein